ncbi:conjugative transposon protein TraK [Pedobacter terrae]|uniref:conjugative transposon protein TraK n=1 Tax=Pedobacter terrae TaxID=405671 RepID=UPI002FF7AC14
MFTQFKNIDTAFRHIKRFSLFLIVACVLLSGFSIYKSTELVSEMQSKVYILANGKAIEAFSTTRKDNLPVELRDHIKTFHNYFFSLDPDDKVINRNIANALYLADESAKKMSDNLKEQGYYNNIISANISQEIEVDSISLDIGQYPFYFRCYATQRLIRSSSVMQKILITKGYVRNVSRSDNNPHGFLIQRWETLKNIDKPSRP